jgi:hypothetical protein
MRLISSLDHQDSRADYIIRPSLDRATAMFGGSLISLHTEWINDSELALLQTTGSEYFSPNVHSPQHYLVASERSVGRKLLWYLIKKAREHISCMVHRECL